MRILLSVLCCWLFAINSYAVADFVIDFTVQDSPYAPQLRRELMGLGFDSGQIEKITELIPTPFVEFAVGNATSAFNWFAAQGVKNPHSLAVKFPPLFRLNVERSLEPRVQWLRQQGVTKIARVLESATSVLGLSIEGNLEPKAKWLSSIGVSNVGALIERAPVILACSLEGNLVPTAQWFVSKGFVKPGAVFEKAPTLMGCSIQKNLEPTLQTLQLIWGLSVDEIAAQPILLTASLKRIQKIAHFLNRIGIDPAFDILPRHKCVAIMNLTEALILDRMTKQKLIESHFQSVRDLNRSDLPAHDKLLEALPELLKKPRAPVCILEAA